MKASLKAELMKYSVVLLGMMMLSCLAQRRDGSFFEPQCDAYDLKEGKIVRVCKTAHDVVPVSGFVLHLYRNADELYYVSMENSKDVFLKAGFFASVRGISQEVALPKEIQKNKIIRLIGEGGAAFLVAVIGEKEVSKLYRIDFNSGKISYKNGIVDAALYDGVPVILLKSGKGYAVDRNGIKVPLAIKGNPKFGNLYEGRILTIVSGEKRELVDLGIMKNIHGFGGRDESAEIGEENLYIEVIDAISDKMEKHVFYKVFVDGTDFGRTDTGPAGQARKYSAKLVEDEHHIIRLERWELKEGRNEYERSNNIFQPKLVRIFLPQHRAIKLMVVRDKKGYSSSTLAMHK